MRIGIDARLIDETGVGRYIRNLINGLAELKTDDEYVVFLRKKSFDAFVLPNKKWSKNLADVAWHTLSEQLVMPKIFNQAQLDLVHIPYHNPPILYGGPMVVTIHDMTILHFDTGRATTLPYALYKLKRFAYRVELAVGLQKARHIIAVSESTKKEIISHFGISAHKISVTYEGVDSALTTSPYAPTPPLVDGPYILYVGNAYPHKNLDRLLAAFSMHHGSSTLVFVGRDDFFYKRLKYDVQSLSIAKSVRFLNDVNDAQLHNLYTHAHALIFPSLMEGFGLPALEALVLGTPVLCSDIPVFHEILGRHAVYFNPHDVADIARVIEASVQAKSRKKISPQTIAMLKRTYNWNSLAAQTQKIYESSIRI